MVNNNYHKNKLVLSTHLQILYNEYSNDSIFNVSFNFPNVLAILSFPLLSSAVLSGCRAACLVGLNIRALALGTTEGA